MSSNHRAEGPANSILIVDPDIKLLLELKNHTAARKTRPILISRADQAVHAIDHTQVQLSAVLVNPQLDGGKIVPVIVQRVLQVSPRTPIFYFCDADEHIYNNEQLKMMSVHKVITRSGNYADVLREVNIVVEEEARLKVDVKPDPQVANQDVVTDDDHFSPYPATNFIFGSMAYFDIHARSNEGRYAIVLRAGDVISKERLDSYLAQGISTFFVRKEAQESYRRFCDVLAAGAKKKSVYSR